MAQEVDWEAVGHYWSRGLQAFAVPRQPELLRVPTQFISKPTDAQLRAIQALKAVRDEGSDLCAVYASVEAEEARKLRSARLVPSRSRAKEATAGWLEKRRPKYQRIDKQPLHIDHTSYWEDKETRERVILTEPYHLNTRHLLKLAQEVKKHNLEVSITSHQSVHYPGATLCVEYRSGTPQPSKGERVLSK